MSLMDYDRAAVVHILAVARWHDWADMIGWLAGEGPNDPMLSPDEFLGLRQDAERAMRSGAEFSNEPDRLWRELRKHHRAR